MNQYERKHSEKDFSGIVSIAFIQIWPMVEILKMGDGRFHRSIEMAGKCSWHSPLDPGMELTEPRNSYAVIGFLEHMI
jgi:hypothetical protein